MRSVVLKPTARCARCHLPPRWCVCAAHQDAVCPLQIDVLMHHRECFRPSSTGNLIKRVIPASRVHVWRRERTLSPADVRVAGRDLWILHPNGEPAPAALPPEKVQILLLDGSWRETSVIAQEVRGWGRLVRLPMSGESRYWLRAQADTLRFSTVEALMFLMNYFGLNAAEAVLRQQLELHVYASLRARGQKEAALEFLSAAPTTAEFARAIAELNVRRPQRIGLDSEEARRLPA